jgi:tellurite resistance protein TerC
MLGLIEITPWHWAGFILLVLVGIAVDMGAFQARPRTVTFREALLWSAFWFALAVAFGGLLCWLRGRGEAVEFATGYLLELSLSLDNILVIALMFAAFHVAPELQRRVLVWGLFGAVAMRGVLIGVGAGLVHEFGWVLYVFGGFLVFTGVKMVFAGKSTVEPEKNPLLRLARRVFPVSPELDGQKFFTRRNGQLMLTPLALVLLLVESADLIFAVDSVPAVFSVTQKAFIVFTSNVFAILGLRSLYFLLAGAVSLFRYLKAGLAVVLVFVGVKMLLDPHEAAPDWYQFRIPNVASLLMVLVILATAIVASLVAARRGKAAAR